MGNNKNMTAVEWFIDWLMDNPITSDGYIEAMIKAKQMEKEQIVNAYSQGLFGEEATDSISAYAEQYYNENYGK